MKDAVMSWVLRGVALVVLGPLAAGLWTSVRAADGSWAATPLSGVGLMGGVFALAALGFVCVLAAGAGSMVLHRREGVLLAGLVMGWVAWASPDMSGVYASGASGVLVKLAVEGVVVMGIVVLTVRAALAAGTGSGVEDPFVGSDGVLSAMKRNGSKGGVIVVVSMASVLAVVWLQVQSGLSGQALWGAAIGGILAGIAGGFVGHSKSDTSVLVLVPCVLGVALAGVVAPLVTMGMVGGGLEARVAAESVPGWALVPSAAWGCGALFGAPIGYGFMLGTLEKHGGVAQAA